MKDKRKIESGRDAIKEEVLETKGFMGHYEKGHPVMQYENIHCLLRETGTGTDKVPQANIRMVAGIILNST